MLRCLPPGVPSVLRRSRPDASTRTLREAAALLRSAAGVKVATSIVPADQGDDESQQSEARVIEYGDPAASHPAALWELAKAYDKGQQTCSIGLDPLRPANPSQLRPLTCMPCSAQRINGCAPVSQPA